jgi:hypothetical protein
MVTLFRVGYRRSFSVKPDLRNCVNDKTVQDNLEKLQPVKFHVP